VTSGDAYTAIHRLAGAEAGRQADGNPPGEACAAVVGATGAIGRASAEILSAPGSRAIPGWQAAGAPGSAEGCFDGWEPEAHLQVSTELADLRHATVGRHRHQFGGAVLQPE